MIKYNIIMIMIMSLLLFTGCSNKVIEIPKEVFIPVKCEIPDVIKPSYYQIDDTDNNSEIVSKTLKNIEIIKEYSKKLEESIKVCK